MKIWCKPRPWGPLGIFCVQPLWVRHESFIFFLWYPSKSADMAEIHDSFPGEVTRRWPPNLGLPAAPLGARSSLEGSWSSAMFWLLLSAPLGLLSLCSGSVLTVFPDPYLCWPVLFLCGLGAVLPAVSAETFAEFSWVICPHIFHLLDGIKDWRALAFMF